MSNLEVKNMYTQVFGHYLLRSGMVTNEQLLSALTIKSSTRVKLGTLAIHQGYMTASEAERVFSLQARRDKLFGEIAVEEGYLTQENVTELLQMQVPGFILLGQVLVDQGILTTVQMQNALTDYRSEFEIDDLDNSEEHLELINHLLADIIPEEDAALQEYISEYLLLLFNNLIRFIGNDFTALNILKLPEVPTDHCSSQSLNCPEFHLDSALNMDAGSAIAFASRYAKNEYTEFNEFVQAAMEDFLNLHNSLFAVNMSNEFSLEVLLDSPEAHHEDLFSPGKTTYLFPILYPFGTVHFVCSIHVGDTTETP